MVAIPQACMVSTEPPSCRLLRQLHVARQPVAAPCFQSHRWRGGHAMWALHRRAGFVHQLDVETIIGKRAQSRSFLARKYDFLGVAADVKCRCIPPAFPLPPSSDCRTVGFIIRTPRASWSGSTWLGAPPPRPTHPHSFSRSHGRGSGGLDSGGFAPRAGRYAEYETNAPGPDGAGDPYWGNESEPRGGRDSWKDMSRRDWRRVRTAVLTNAVRLAQRTVRLVRAQLSNVTSRPEMTPGETAAVTGVACGAVLALLARKPSLFLVSVLLALVFLAVAEEEAVTDDGRTVGERDGWPRDEGRTRRPSGQAYPSNGAGAERSDWARAGQEWRQPAQRPRRQAPAGARPVEPPRSQQPPPPPPPPPPQHQATAAPAQANASQGPWMASLLEEVASVQDDVAAVAEGVRAGGVRRGEGGVDARGARGAGDAAQGGAAGATGASTTGRSGVDGAGVALSERELLLARLLSLNTKLRQLSNTMAGEVEAVLPGATAAVGGAAVASTPQAAMATTGAPPPPVPQASTSGSGAAAQDALLASALQARVEEVEARLAAAVRNELEAAMAQWTVRSAQAISLEVGAKLEAELGAKLGGLEGAVRKAVEASVAEAVAASAAASAGASDAERVAALSAEMDRICDRVVGTLRRDMGLMLEPVATLPALLTRHYAEEGSRMTVEMVKEMERMRDTAVASGSRALDAAVQQLSAATTEQVDELLRQQRRQQLVQQEEVKALGVVLASVAEGVKASRDGASSLPGAVAERVETRMANVRAGWVQEVAQLIAQRDKAAAADTESVRASLKSLHTSLAALATATGELRSELQQSLARGASASPGSSTQDDLSQGVDALQGAVAAIDAELGRVSTKVGVLVTSLEKMSEGVAAALKSGGGSVVGGNASASSGTNWSTSELQATVTEGVRAGMRDMLVQVDALKGSMAAISSLVEQGGSVQRGGAGDDTVMSLLTSAVSRLEAAVRTLNACIGDVGEGVTGGATSMDAIAGVAMAAPAASAGSASTGQRVALLPLLAALSSLLPALEGASATAAGRKEGGVGQGPASGVRTASTGNPVVAPAASTNALAAPVLQPSRGGASGQQAMPASGRAAVEMDGSRVAMEGRAATPSPASVPVQVPLRGGSQGDASIRADTYGTPPALTPAGAPSSMERVADIESGSGAGAAVLVPGGMEPGNPAAIAVTPIANAATRAPVSEGNAYMSDADRLAGQGTAAPSSGMGPEQAAPSRRGDAPGSDGQAMPPPMATAGSGRGGPGGFPQQDQPRMTRPADVDLYGDQRSRGEGVGGDQRSRFGDPRGGNVAPPSSPPPPSRPGRPSLPNGRPDMFRQGAPPMGADASSGVSGGSGGAASNGDMRRAAAQQEEAFVMDAARRRRQQAPSPPPYQQQQPPPPNRQQPPTGYQQQPPPPAYGQPPPPTQGPRGQWEDGRSGWAAQAQGPPPPQEASARARVARADTPPPPSPAQTARGAGAVPAGPPEDRQGAATIGSGRRGAPGDGSVTKQITAKGAAAQGVGDGVEGPASGAQAWAGMGQAVPGVSRPAQEEVRGTRGGGQLSGTDRAGRSQGDRGVPWDVSAELSPRVPVREDRGGAFGDVVSSDGRLSLKVVGEEELRLFLAEGAQQLALARELMQGNAGGAGGSSSNVPTGRIVEMLDNAAVLFSRAADVAPGSVLAFGQWGNCLLASGQVKVGVVQQLRAAQAAMRAQAQARGVPVPAGEAAELASTLALVEQEAEEALVLAGRKFRVAMGLDSRDERALYNWGLALCYRAKLMGRPRAAEAENLYKAAIEKFQAAIALNSDLTGALMNWGVALRDCATLNEPGNPRRASFLEMARERFLVLLDRQPDNAAAATACDEIEVELAAEYEREAAGNMMAPPTGPGMLPGATRQPTQPTGPSMPERGNYGPGPEQGSPPGSGRGAPRDSWQQQQQQQQQQMPGRKQPGPGRRGPREDDRGGGGLLSRIRRP
eukprot:jgi/Mesvir1/9290/Mv04470-RA.2